MVLLKYTSKFKLKCMKFLFLIDLSWFQVNGEAEKSEYETDKTASDFVLLTFIK